MTGCRHNAKNTLVKNYLYLAERAGAEVRPLTTVTRVRSSAGGYLVDTRRTGRRRRTVIEAEQVIFAAGALGTQRLLHAARDRGDLGHLSGKLGFQTRTNSESLLGASTARVTRDFSRGVAITSSFHPDAHTHVEPVRYGRGSNLMGLLQTVLVPGDTRAPRVLAWLGRLVRHPVTAARTLWLRRWSERTVIALVMQNLDNSLIVTRRRGRLTSRQGDGAPNPDWIPAAHQVARLLADEIGGEPGGNIGEILRTPMTAHILGGCAIGADPSAGVIDPYHRVYGHPGLHVVDGAAVSANLGVNPSLTITAQAERAMAFWPNRGEPDPRPALGVAYEQLRPLPPHTPAVPATAPAALPY
jgi:cholesterol oxidase